MAITIIPKKSSVTGKVPDSTSLEVGEIAVNLADGKIYTKRSDNTVINLSGSLEGHAHSISDVSGLQAELDGKVDSVNGLEGTVVLNSDDIGEGTGNLYFTDARAISAIRSDPSWNASDWDTAFSWGDHSIAGYALDSSISTVGKTGDYNDLTNKPDLSAFDEVRSYVSFTSFPASGETGKVYVAEDTGYLYRWSGVEYVQLTDQTAIWGDISGTLSNQTDLQNALDGKANSSHSHASGDLPSTVMYEGDNISLLNNNSGYITSAQAPVQSVNGSTGSVVLDTNDVSEGTTNLYFTNARARGAISVSGDLSYSGGVISFNETYSSASELLTAIKGVDGTGSGLNADLLDGQHGSYYLDYNNLTNKPQAGGLNWQLLTSSSTVESYDGIIANTAGGSFTVTLPSSPSTGSMVSFTDSTGSWETNNLIVDGGTNQVITTDTTLICDVNYQSFTLVYGNGKWNFAY